MIWVWSMGARMHSSDVQVPKAAPRIQLAIMGLAQIRCGSVSSADEWLPSKAPTECFNILAIFNSPCPTVEQALSSRRRPTPSLVLTVLIQTEIALAQLDGKPSLPFSLRSRLGACAAVLVSKRYTIDNKYVPHIHILAGGCKKHSGRLLLLQRRLSIILLVDGLADIFV